MNIEKSIQKKIRDCLRSTRYHNHVNDQAWEYTWMNGFRMEISKILDLKPADKVLDVGCGDGWFSIQNALKHPDAEFSGVDLFEADEAEEISKLVGAGNCNFFELDALEMDFKEKFDHLVLFMAMGNICEDASDVRRLLDNCRNAMRNEAKLLIVEPFEEDFPKEVRNKLKNLYRIYKERGYSYGEEKETILSRTIVLDILQSTGFNILQAMKHRFNWSMEGEEVRRYFGFERLPFEISGRFWVFDKPKQVTVILASKN